MKKTFIVLLFVPLLVLSQKKISLEDIWARGTFFPKRAQGFNVLKDGLHYVGINKTESGSLVLSQYEISSGKKVKDLVSGSDISYNGKAVDLGSYEFSPGEDKLLLSENAEYIYRHSARSDYFVYEIASRQTKRISEKGKIMFPKFSPDGKNLAFVRDNNLFITNLASGAETGVTNDGAQNRIKNGWADWVYEEEFSRPDYFEWSPDGKFLAWVRFDESRVKEYTMDIYKGELYPVKNTFKYPKAGEDNSIVTVHIFDLEKGSAVNVEIGTETDIYIPRIQFTNDPRTLCVQRLNRLQNKLEFLFADVATGLTRVVYTDESKTYVDITDDLTFVGNSGFIVSSERDNFNHLYYYDLNGRLIKQLTQGNWDVTGFKGYDEATKTLYFVSTERGAVNRDVYSVGLDGKNKKRLSQQEGQTDFNFTRGYRYYLSSWSDANTPPVYGLYNIRGKLLKTLEDNAELRARMQQYRLSKREFRKFTMPDGVELNGWVMMPHDFDSTKKYPVFMYAYNGPGSNLVNNSWSAYDYFWHNLLNQEGYMVVCVDGRGTMGRGREFKHITYMQLGKVETIDQLDVARQLGALPYVDKSRIGFMGWSYGGYMASLMISKGADLIKAAIAVAPVTNWKYYDNIYTERFMRKPQENKSGYEDNSPVNFVKQIRGKFLLIHGSADDNVHLQNTMEMANALVQNNIPFDMMVYPNKNHGISGGLTRLHIYTKMLKFVKENL